jgi:hypothetical protein
MVFQAFGTATIDGQLDPGEWDSAARVDFLANVPLVDGGGTTPATLFVMNDSANLYLGVKVLRTQLNTGDVGFGLDQVVFEFDNDHNEGTEEGDDILLLSPGINILGVSAFFDEVRTTRSPCPPGVGLCGFLDVQLDVPGTNDGAGAATNNGTFTFFEISHPLDSADDQNDFNLGVGSTVGFRLVVNLSAITSCTSDCQSTTTIPASGVRGDIVIASADSTPPLISLNLSASPNAAGWNNTNVTVSWGVADSDSGIVSTSGCDATALTDETGGTTLTCSAQNGAGLSSSNSVTVKIDKTAPSIGFSGNGGAYSVDQTILITCLASDGLSGIATTSCPAVASGPATNYVGTTNATSTTLTAAATDNAGNTASASTTFIVTVTADGICRLVASLEKADAICARAMSIATAPNAAAKVGGLNAFDHFLAAQSGNSIAADLATLLSRLTHLL